MTDWPPLEEAIERLTTGLRSIGEAPVREEVRAAVLGVLEELKRPRSTERRFDDQSAQIRREIADVVNKINDAPPPPPKPPQEPAGQ